MSTVGIPSNLWSVRAAIPWALGFLISSSVLIANYILNPITNPHVLGATNDVAFVIVTLFLMPMAVIWGIMEHRRDLWERMAIIVLISFASEMLSWVGQRGHYGTWRVGNILGKCGTDKADPEMCRNVATLLTDWVWIPGCFQWMAVVAMISISSPVLAHYMPRCWFIASVTLATCIWWSMLYLFTVIS